MKPFRFGPTGRQLYGCLHVPDDVSNRGKGVLMCNPFGQEAIRSHRLQKIMADRLTKIGFHVLRFDYFGSGDSDGDDAEIGVKQWCDDVCLADEELRKQSAISVTSWLGIRLGASLACLASQQSRVRPQHLVLWDPVVEGRYYLAELARAHVDGIALDYGGRWAIDKKIRTIVEQSTLNEALGYPVTAAFRSELTALSGVAMANANAAYIHAFFSKDTPQTLAFTQALQATGSPSIVRPIQSEIQWASIEALNSAIVPADAMQLIVSALTSESVPQ